MDMLSVSRSAQQREIGVVDRKPSMSTDGPGRRQSMFPDRRPSGDQRRSSGGTAAMSDAAPAISVRQEASANNSFPFLNFQLNNYYRMTCECIF